MNNLKQMNPYIFAGIIPTELTCQSLSVFLLCAWENPHNLFVIFPELSRSNGFQLPSNKGKRPPKVF